MSPRIGIALEIDRTRRPGRSFVSLDAAYANAVVEAGGTPVYLSHPAAPERLLTQIDALLIPGGGDFVPETPPEGVVFRPVDAAQLGFDRALLAAALVRGLPVLGVCYGMQLLALHCGGSLVYDIETELPRAELHQLGTGAHAISIASGTRLAETLGEERTLVNSRHHQGVASPGAGMRVCARSDDGVIEAIEAEDARFVLGVQWHPESMPEPHRRRLFGAFVSAVAAAF